MTSIRNSAAAWLRLLRLPNLFTAPGDPVAGYMLALAGSPAGTAGANELAFFTMVLLLGIPSVLLYAAGLVHNDTCDSAADAQTRPGRPIPAGDISSAAARAAAFVFFAAGIAAALYLSHASGGGFVPPFTALALSICIVLYNRCLKNVPAAGPISMGTCRCLSFLFGASFVCAYTPELPAVAIGLLLYVSAITVLADDEDAARTTRYKQCLPLVVLAVWPAWFFLRGDASAVVAAIPLWCSLGCYGIALGAAAWVFLGPRPGNSPEKRRTAVSLLIRNLLLLQASICFACPGGTVPAMILLAFWFPHLLLSKRFSPT